MTYVIIGYYNKKATKRNDWIAWRTVEFSQRNVNGTFQSTIREGAFNLHMNDLNAQGPGCTKAGRFPPDSDLSKLSKIIGI